MSGLEKRLARLEKKAANMVPEPEPEPPRIEDYLTSEEIAKVNEALEQAALEAGPHEKPTLDRPPELGRAFWIAVSRMPPDVRPGHLPTGWGLERKLKMYQTACRHPEWLLQRNHLATRHAVLSRNRREELGLKPDDAMPLLPDDHPERVTLKRLSAAENCLLYGFNRGFEQCAACGWGYEDMETCDMCGCDEVGVDLYYQHRRECKKLERTGRL